MVIENIHMAAVEKPWGSSDLGQWRQPDQQNPIGELWFAPPSGLPVEPSLLVKLLFTSEPLSIQVHPNDAFARTLGLKTGKTEAWVVLSAEPGAKIAVGLVKNLTKIQLRAAVIDGSIAELVAWRTVATGDVVFVPGGTIHAMGPGVIILEVQQRSDTTFRLFDFGRGRKLDVENAVNAAYPHPATDRLLPTRLNEARLLLLSSAYFTIEQVDLPPDSTWRLSAGKEIWVLALEGTARFGETAAKSGEAMFIQSESLPLTAGAEGFKCLMAYAEPNPRENLLQSITPEKTPSAAAEFTVRAALYEAANAWVRSTGVTP